MAGFIVLEQFNEAVFAPRKKEFIDRDLKTVVASFPAVQLQKRNNTLI